MSGEIEFAIDTKALEERFKSMLGKLGHFRTVDIGTGLSEFQTDIMGRNRPFTMRYRGKGWAQTKIRQHSLFEMERSARAQRRQRKAVPRYQAFLASGKRRRRRRPKYVYYATMYRKWSTRPILRSKMFSELKDLMDYFLKQKITWTKGHGG